MIFFAVGDTSPEIDVNNTIYKKREIQHRRKKPKNNVSERDDPLRHCAQAHEEFKGGLDQS